MAFKLGIDDAGRGPVIGPMVLAGCLIEESFESELKDIGVKDSKMLTDKRRMFLDGKIKEKIEDFEVVIVYPAEIDSNTKNNVNLNEVEAIACAKIINRINKGLGKIKVIIDCPSVSIEKWKDMLRSKVENLSNLEIYCEHKADVNHVSVSAASIIAKNVRENEMGKLKKKYGPEIGSGYASDPATCKFLEVHAKKYRTDGIFRESWETWKKAVENLEQVKLNKF